MDRQEWKAAAERKLQRLAQTIHEWAPVSVYGAMSAATLWPLIQAAGQDPLGPAVALGSVLGGIGGNLIANQLQRWRDRSEAELAAELGQLAASDAQWLRALDALLQEFQAPRVVQAILGEMDKAIEEGLRQVEEIRTGLGESPIRLKLRAQGAAS